MIDVSSLRKGTKIKLVSGVTVYVTGLFLSSDGPIVMGKKSSDLAAAQNIPVSEIAEIVKED